MRIPEPVLAEDFYMVKRIGGDVTLPTPRTRFEKLLYIYAGGTIERPMPKTVEERFLDYITGGESELPVPKTRLQSYMYNVANPSNKIPVVPPKTRFECYWFVMAEGNNVISDKLPVEFTSVDGFLLDYTIWGNSEQVGTPTPEEPIEVQSVGDLVIDEIDPNYGKYKIPVTVSGENGEETTTVIYLDDPLRKIGDYVDYINFENQQHIKNVAVVNFTGEEEWRVQGNAYFTYIPPTPSEKPPTLCSAFSLSTSGSTPVGKYRLAGIDSWNGNVLFNYDNGADGVVNFKSYLAQQYANGTPVKFYYPTVSAITELIEAPKIPTFSGTNVIDTDSTVKPSKIEVVTRTE